MQSITNFHTRAIRDEEQIKTMLPIDIMRQIDFFVEDIANHVNGSDRIAFRLIRWNEAHMEYAKWSSMTNGIVRNKLKDNSNWKYQAVYSYWWNRYWFLEDIIRRGIHEKSTWEYGSIKKTTKKRIEDERIELKNLIESDFSFDKLTNKQKDIILNAVPKTLGRYQ